MPRVSSHIQKIAYSVLEDKLDALTSEKVDTECEIIDMDAEGVEILEEKPGEEKEGTGNGSVEPKTVIDNLLEPDSSDDGMEDDEMRLRNNTYNIRAHDGLRVCSGYNLVYSLEKNKFSEGRVGRVLRVVGVRAKAAAH